MGTMNKMRENTGVVLWILIISFGGLWVLQDSGVFDTIGANPLGKMIIVDGDAITAQEYNNTLDFQAEQYRQQTGESMPPQRMDLERERVFNGLIDNKLREHEMDRLGVTVSDKEIQALITGPTPHAIIKARFSDGQGGVDQALLQSVIDSPEAEAQWIQLEDYIRIERRRQKFENLITATVRVSDQDVEEEYYKNNARASAEFFLLRYADVPNDSVELTARDLRRFYDEHHDDFKRERVYTLEMASLSKWPVRQDTLDVLNDLEKARSFFAEAEDDSLFLLRNASERPYTRAFFAPADLDPEIAEAVFETPEPGTVVGPVISGNEAHLIKITDARPAEEPNVRARHILFSASPANEEELATARQEANAFKTRIQNGEDFAALAREHSDDPGSGALGGDLGWFGDGKMVAPFQETAFAASIDEVVGPVETQFGFHLIEVTHRAEVEVRLADYALRLLASPTTLQAAEDHLEDLKYYAEDNGDFRGEAERSNITLRSVQVEQDQQIIPDFGNSRSLMQFLETAEAGDISEAIELDEVFIVARVAEIQPEGFRPLEEVENEIRPRALLDKKKSVQRERMEHAYHANGFEGLADALGISSRTANNISFNNQLVPGLGRDAFFAGTILGLAEGEDSGVVEGANGVFVAKVTQARAPTPITDAERDRLRTQMLNRRKSAVQSQWVVSLREKANIVDMRSTFQQ